MSRNMPAHKLFLSSSSESSASLDCANTSKVANEAESRRSEIIVPYIGQMFYKLEEVEIFYRSYAHKNGFEIRIASTHKHAHTNDVSSRIYVCKKAGKPNAPKSLPDDEDSSEKRKKQRDSIERTFCKARICVVHNKNEDNWRISTVELNHNHHVVTPTKVNLIETHRNITPIARSLIDTLHQSGLPPSRMMNVMSTIGQGMQNVPFSNVNIQNVVRDLRRESEDENDAQAALNYLKKLGSKSASKFFYRVKTGENNHISCILWVDARSRLMYQLFGDVVTFDTTYRTNKYQMPFVPFTGVNHHYQSILFGFALLRDETEDTFVWALETWQEAMDYKTPITIITDQDKAMSNAISTVLPSTHHVLCSWHISNKFPEKLHHVYYEHPTFKEQFNNCVYNSISIGEFEERWQILMKDYDLCKNEWLQSLYEVREKWIRPYTKRYFAAGMTTTGRSESMNSYFDEFVNASTGMKDFVVKTEKAIEKQFMRERKSDYVTKHRKRSMVQGTSLEMHAATIYTKEMFRRFQRQLIDSLKFNVHKVSELCAIDTKVYAVYRSDTTEGNRRYKEVINNRQLQSITCNCQMFTHSGEICRHILRYFINKSISEIPEAMILPRWTKDANKRNGEEIFVSPTKVDFEQNQSMRYNHLIADFQELATKAACSVKCYKAVLKLNAQGKALVDQYDPDENVTELSDDDLPPGVEGTPSDMHFEVSGDEQRLDTDTEEEYLPPKISQTKGRKKQSRFKSAFEKIVGTKAHRKCAICGFETDHDKRNHYRVLGIPDPNK